MQAKREAEDEKHRMDDEAQRMKDELANLTSELELANGTKKELVLVFHLKLT